MQAHPFSRQSKVFRYNQPSPRGFVGRKNRGLTLIEVSLVIAVMLGLVSVLLLGFTAYKQGADRATCIQNIGSVQKAMRSYSNLNGKSPGDTVTGLQGELIGPGKFFNTLTPCPGGGTYTFSGDTIVEAGNLFMNCSIGDHEPKVATGW